MGASARRFYKPELDGLRFFAFFAVYVNHTFLFGASGHHHHMSDGLAHALGAVGLAGAFGVDLFFALSAYLITELLLREREQTGTLDVGAFYVRRVLRIWPLYFLFLGLSWALALFVPGESMDLRHLIGFALFSGNWAYMLSPIGTVAAPLWSVSVEEQFYILWPWAVRRGSLRRFVGIALGIIAFGMALRLALGLHGINEPWVSKSSLTRADGIAVGVLLAAALRGRAPRLSPAARWVLLASGVGMLIWIGHAFGLFDKGPVATWHEVLGWPLVAASGGAILLATLGSRDILGRTLSTKPLVYLGRISYGLYVFHQVGLLVAGRLFPTYSSDTKAWVDHFLVGLAVTVLLAALSYRFIEQPFLKLKQRRYTVVHSRPDAPSV